MNRKKLKPVTMDDIKKALTPEEMESFAEGCRALYGDNEGADEPCPPLDLRALNNSHVRGYDKWYRMFAGAASTLTAFENGILHLDIHVDNRLTDSLETITHKIAGSWTHMKELGTVTGYVAHLYKSERPSGWVCSMENRTPEDVGAELFQKLKEIPEVYPDVFITTIRGQFGED